MARLNINEVRYAGTLTRDPETKNMPSGDVFAFSSLAINKSWKDKEGEWHTKATFVRIKAFGYPAEKLASCAKGDNILIFGETEDNKWMKDGEEVVTQEVKVHRVFIIPLSEPAPAAMVEDNGVDDLVGDDSDGLPF